MVISHSISSQVIQRIGPQRVQSFILSRIKKEIVRALVDREGVEENANTRGILHVAQDVSR